MRRFEDEDLRHAHRLRSVAHFEHMARRSVISPKSGELLGAECRLPPPGSSGGSPPAMTSARGTFVRSSAEVLGKTNVNAYLVIASECRDQVNSGGHEERRKEPSDLPTMKDG